jgi:hypothetical protein
MEFKSRNSSCYRRFYTNNIAVATTTVLFVDSQGRYCGRSALIMELLYPLGRFGINVRC